MSENQKIVKSVVAPIKEVLEAGLSIKRSREDGKVTIGERFRNIREVLDIPLSFFENRDFKINILAVAKDPVMEAQLVDELKGTFEKYGVFDKEEQKEKLEYATGVALNLIGLFR